MTRLVVLMYVRFALSLRNVKDLQGEFFVDEIGRKHPGTLFRYHQD